jgi:5-(carboxyamino)imidazole ribonucleotide mutase
MTRINTDERQSVSLLIREHPRKSAVAIERIINLMDARPLVGIIMGSRNDYTVMRNAVEMLVAFGVPHEVRIVSAHRTPDLLFEYAETAADRGLRVIIAGAGGAAHLPGMVAAKTVVPVLGVPIPATSLQGMDSLLSIVQMPKGVPVGTLAIGAAGAANAGLLAAQMLATTDARLREKLTAWRAARRDEVLAQTIGEETPEAAKAGAPGEFARWGGKA